MTESPGGGVETLESRGERVPENLVSDEDGLSGPGEMADPLFIYNFANQSPGDGAIVRTRV